MTVRDDLKAVNHALRELVRLQLAAELAPDDAWRERRQMLASVEEVWDTLPEAAECGPDADAALAADPADAASVRTAPGRVRCWRPRAVPFGVLLLVLAVLTFMYVGSL